MLGPAEGVLGLHPACGFFGPAASWRCAKGRPRTEKAALQLRGLQSEDRDLGARGLRERLHQRHDGGMGV